VDAPSVRKQELAGTATDDAERARTNKKPYVFAGLLQAADGTRTHDLLHGKQTFAPANDAGNACKTQVLNRWVARANPVEKEPIRAYTEPQRD
jgi:hypothetical protein